MDEKKIVDTLMAEILENDAEIDALWVKYHKIKSIIEQKPILNAIEHKGVYSLGLKRALSIVEDNTTITTYDKETK